LLSSTSCWGSISAQVRADQLSRCCSTAVALERTSTTSAHCPGNEIRDETCSEMFVWCFSVSPPFAEARLIVPYVSVC
jgi:hypothetical protein